VNCAEVERGEYMERYLAKELGEGEVRELEDHWFACADCFQALKDSWALRSELAEDRWAIRARLAPARRQWRWAWAAAVAVVLVGVGVAILPRFQERADGVRHEIARLAAIEAPPYAPRTLRSPGSEAEGLFREAMALYQEGDCAGAISGLKAAVSLDTRLAKSLFYLGACYLLTDQPEPAIASFGRVVELGRTPYLERARLYRAKAFLRAGNLEAAKEELEEVVRLGGKLEADARRILDQLPR